MLLCLLYNSVFITEWKLDIGLETSDDMQQRAEAGLELGLVHFCG